MIYDSITSFFPDLNWKTLAYEPCPHLRFYFDQATDDLEKILVLSNEIITKIYSEEDRIVVGISLYNQNGNLDKKQKKSIIARDLSKVINFSETKLIEIEENIFWFYFFGEIDTDDVIKINKTIIESDFSIDPVLQLHCYYFFEKEESIIHLYDDRGMDIISNNKVYLEKIYIEWKDIVPIKKFF